MADTRPGDLPHLQRIQRTLRLVQQCRRALLHATDENDLLQAVCEIAVAEGGYPFAWVGVAEQDEAKRMRPAAQAGKADGYLDAIDVRWSEHVPQGLGPTGFAIRNRKPYWTRSIATDPAWTPWREQAMKQGFQSAIALPMTTDRGVFGALSIYSNMPDAFDAEEVSLLTELAEDLAFGISTLRTRLAHRIMAHVIEQNPAVVLMTDLTGNIEYVNPRFTELTGYSLEEVKGRNPRLLKSGATSDAEYAELWKTVTSGGRWNGTFHQRRKDGSLYEERASIQPVYDSSGRMIRFVKIAEDISELNSLEQQLRQAQKMEAIGRLAGGVAHDFNNLLTAIQGFTELALQNLTDDDPVRPDLEQVLAAGDHASDLTKQLLAFSRHRPAETEMIDVAAAVRAAEPILRRLIGDDVSLQVNASDATCVALAEPGQIEQILVNLAVNARDAMPHGGLLHVSAAQVWLDHHQPSRRVDLPAGAYVCLEVRDNGQGMDEATRSHVFEPFFTTKPVGKGTGLGLSTVYGIVKQGNGDIDIASAPGEGTTVRIWLPLATTSGHTGAASVRDRTFESRPGSGTVLVVDDDRAICQFADRVLQRAGFEVMTALDPGEALLIAEQHGTELDLLLTDVVMPHMNGRELARRVGQMLPALRVAYMSGYTDDVLLQNEVASGEIQLLRKPFGAEALLKKVRASLDGPPSSARSGSEAARPR